MKTSRQQASSTAAGSQTMDPRAPHSSLPSGTGRTDTPMAKRARLRYLNDDDDDDDEQRPTFKSSNGQIICLEPAGGIGNLVLPIDLLTSSLLYLDVGDLPSALAVCKDWGKALQSAEDELWLGLIRKHCPSVEEITNLLELPPKEKLVGSGGSIGGAISSDIPSPSKNWRRQFQCHLLLSKPDGSATVQKPPPKPLSAYIFQVDLVLYRKKEGEAGKGDQVGVVSRVFPDAKFKSGDDKAIGMKMRGLHEEMKRHTFTYVDFRVTMYEKATGRQAVVHCCGIDELWDDKPMEWITDYYPITEVYKVQGLFETEKIETTLIIRRTGCSSHCGYRECFTDNDVINKPPACCHCRCDVKWSCFWDVEIDLRFAAYFEWDVIHLEEEAKLHLFEQHIEFQ